MNEIRQASGQGVVGVASCFWFFQSLRRAKRAALGETSSGKSIFWNPARARPVPRRKWAQKARVHAYIHTFVRVVLRYFLRPGGMRVSD